MTTVPVIELDRLLWLPGLAPWPAGPMNPQLQRELMSLTADHQRRALRPHDALEFRRQAADTVIVLDLSVARWACRALRRSRERLDLWPWLSS
jgi:hypothetical protein